MENRKKRILMAKIGLDYHSRGVKVISRLLRDKGFEVVYTGLYQRPEMIVATALQEDVDLIGISILSGAHLTLISKLTHLIAEQGISIPIIVGGIIPERDVAQLKKLGVKEIFGPGTTLDAISDCIGEYLED